MKGFCTPAHPFWYEGLPQLCPKTCNQCPPPPSPPPPSTGKCSVFVPGLVATYGPGFPPFVPIATINCAKETTAEGCIYMAQGGGGAKAPLCAWTPTPVTPPPSSPQTPVPSTPEKSNTIIPVIPPDHPRQKRINEVLNPIIGTGSYQSPLPVAQ